MKKITFNHEVHISPITWALFSIIVLIMLNHTTSWRSGSLFSVWAEALKDATQCTSSPHDIAHFVLGFLFVVGVPCAAAAVGGWVLAALLGVVLAFRHDAPLHQTANPRRDRVVVAFLLTASLAMTFFVVKTLFE